MLIAPELYRKQGSTRRQRFVPHIPVLVLQQIEDVESKIAPIAPVQCTEIGQTIVADRHELAVEDDRPCRQGLDGRRLTGSVWCSRSPRASTG